MAPTRLGPPNMEDVAHTLGDPDRFTRTKSIAEETLVPLGLGWDDLEDVIPMGSMHQFYIQYRRRQTNNHRHAFLCPGSTAPQLQTSLERVFTKHSMLHTMAMCFDPNTPSHNAIRPSEKWYSHRITIVSSIKSNVDLNTLVYNDPLVDFAYFPSPIFRMVLTHVEEENSAGLIYQGQQSVFDALSLPLFLEDLETLLHKPGGKNKTTRAI